MVGAVKLVTPAALVGVQRASASERRHGGIGPASTGPHGIGFERRRNRTRAPCEQCERCDSECAMNASVQQGALKSPVRPSLSRRDASLTRRATDRARRSGEALRWSRGSRTIDGATHFAGLADNAAGGRAASTREAHRGRARADVTAAAAIERIVLQVHATASAAREADGTHRVHRARTAATVGRSACVADSGVDARRTLALRYPLRVRPRAVIEEGYAVASAVRQRDATATEVHRAHATGRAPSRLEDADLTLRAIAVAAAIERRIGTLIGGDDRVVRRDVRCIVAAVVRRGRARTTGDREERGEHEEGGAHPPSESRSGTQRKHTNGQCARRSAREGRASSRRVS